MIDERQRAALLEALPASAVSERTASGQTLSYVEGWWVIGQLNEIFGPCGWSYEVETHEAVRLEEPNPKRPGETRWRVSYRARCVLRVGECVIADVGHGHGIDRDCGAAIESAEKEAATDALKRSAKSLGWRLGLALYDRQREHVVDDTAQPEPVRAAVDETRVLREWRGMSEADLRALWPSLSRETRATIRAAREAAQKGGA